MKSGTQRELKNCLSTNLSDCKCNTCRSGGIGRREGFKIPFLPRSEGSIPSFGITFWLIFTRYSLPEVSSVMFEILRFCDVENLQKNAASLIACCLNSVLASKGTAVLALCGGRSAAGVFKHLSSQKIDWSRVHIFMADERCVPIDSPESNYKLALDSFFGDIVKKGIMPAANLHPFIAGDNLEDSLADYNQQLAEYGGIFDMVLLSIGEDGHIASLFPYHASIKDSESDSFILVNDAPKPPARRISASKNLIKKSKCSLLMVIGEDKRQAFISMDDEVYDAVDCPAKLVKTIPCSYLLTTLDKIQVNMHS